jgi:NADPH-dependent glutamate synthase beta subunit-like oxidoreductase
VDHERGEASAGIPGVEVAGRRVVVIGEDDTAVDCARTALRRGSVRSDLRVSASGGSQLACCRREFEDAEEEGVQF